MLPRDFRLPPTQRSRPLATFRSPLFSGKVFPTALPHSRFGFVVSKKVSPKAVARNRVKRQFRGVIETLLPQLSGGYDILFIVHRDALDATADELRDAITRFLREHRLLT